MNKKILFISLIAIIVVGFFLLLLYRGSMFSKEILRLEILGPESAKVGEEIEYTIKYKNNGNFALENPKLIFVMPEGSLTEDSKTLITQELKDIYPGGEEFVKIKARLLGKEGDIKTSKASLSYTPKNLTAKYESTTSFTTKIDKVPMTLDFDLPSKVEKGKETQFSINYFSNIDYPLENLSLKVEPVAGFELKSSDPSSLDNVEWKLKTLSKAQGGRINIKGIPTADTNKTLTFSAQLGMWQNGNFTTIKEVSTDVEVIQPLLLITQQVNGSSSYVASSGETLNYQVFFRNIGTTPFENLYMIVKLDSATLDMSSVQAGDGQVNDSMIVWDHRQVQNLRRLDVQQEGQVSFSIKVRNDLNVQPQAEGTIISNEVNISQISQKFSIKVNSGLVISQRGFFKSSDIANSGPVPPKVGTATTYTINWEIKNYFSDTKNVKVKAVLPPNVSLTGKFLPENEASNFSFDSASREIVWSVGDVLAGTGVNGDPISMSFQVSLNPTPAQKGSKASLIGPSQISGENQFTNTIITAQDSDVDTGLPDDFSNSGGGIVQ